MVNQRFPLRIAVDLDMVVYNTMGYFIHVMQREFKLLDGYSLNDYTTWKVWECFPGVTEELAQMVFQRPNFYRFMPVMPGAHVLLRRLDSEGEVTFLTSRPECVAEATRDTVRADWGDRYDIVHTQDKVDWCRAHEVRFAFEDAPHHVEALADAGVRVMMPSYAYNEHVKTEHRPIHRYFMPWEAVRALRYMRRWLPEPVIKDKADMYWRFNRGHFGNAGINYGMGYEGMMRAGILGKQIGMRYAGVGGLRFDAHVHAGALVSRTEEWKACGYDVERIQYSEMMPDEHVRLNAEVMRSINYYDLTYSTVPMAMRAGMKAEQKYTTGLRANQILQHYLDGDSLSTLEEIFDRWPSAVVELSAYAIPVGNLQRNTIFWEVRHY